LCFEGRLLIETCGPRDQVLKIMPALTIERDALAQGLSVIAAALARQAAGTSLPGERPLQRVRAMPAPRSSRQPLPVSSI
jgi:diaminobutyrate-2-oxoglutarate transaminase